MKKRTTAPLRRRDAAKRVLITGAAGFIGSHVTERLLKDGHEVVGADNFLTGDWNNLVPFVDHPRFRFLHHDVVHPLRLDGPVDWLLHFASPASPPKYMAYPLETMRSNAEGTYHLLELAQQKGGRFFFASTSEVYGDPREHPQPEAYWGHVNPTGPRSVYDEGKRYAEALITGYHRRYGLSVRVARIFNTYGPRMQQDDGRVVSNFITQALRGVPLTVYGDGTQTRSFQYVDDLVDGILRLMEVDYCSPINLGNPQEHTMLELARLIKEATGSEAPIVHQPLPQDDPKQRRPNIELAERLLEWRPRVLLGQGLARTVGYFRDLERAEREQARGRPLSIPSWFPSALRPAPPRPALVAGASAAPKPPRRASRRIAKTPVRAVTVRVHGHPQAS